VGSQTEERFDELKGEDMSLITISHRLSTIRKADRVLVLNERYGVEKKTWLALASTRTLLKAN